LTFLTIKALLFDFDGTLANSSPGIIASLKYALKKNGVGANVTEEKINNSIGPPLVPFIERVLNGKADENMMKAIAISYREHYTEKGLFMAELYDGVENALNYLHEKYMLFVVSSKPEVFLRKLMVALNIGQYFKNIYGPGLELAPLKKAELVKACMAENNLKTYECIMIGDKAEDIAAAAANGIKSLGALYGFGTAEELQIAGASFLIESPHDFIKMDYDRV